MPVRIPRCFARGWLLAILLAAGAAGLPGARGEGTVTTNSTTALLHALGGGGLVQLNFLGTLTLEIPLLIAADTVLDGSGPGGRIVTISGGSLLRPFRVLPGIRFEVRNLVVQNGLSTHGGAILNEGILLASNVTFLGNAARGALGTNGAAGEVRFGYGYDGRGGTPGTSAEGGALYNTGEATLVDCIFDGNEAEGGGGGTGGAGGDGGWRQGAGGNGGDGAPAYGGAIANLGSLDIAQCQFVGNSAQGGDGGAGGTTADTDGGAGNGGLGAVAVGGAIFSQGLLSLTRSSFATNAVLGGDTAAAGSPTKHIGDDGRTGGSVYGGALATWGTGTVANVTFFTNLLVGGAGGNGGAGSSTFGDGGDGGSAFGSGIHARGVLTVNHATLVSNFITNGTPGAAGSTNRSENGGPGRARGSAIAADSGADVRLMNSILTSAYAATVEGAVTDAGFNLFSDAGAAVLGPRSVRHTDPVLSRFQVWESGPPGMLPLSGSPALDNADAADPLAVDQRGFPRPAGGGPDVGAMEVGALSYYLAGRVLDGTTGVTGVRIEVGEDWQLTDGQGRFRFGPLPTGFYTVAIAGGGLGYTPRLVQVPLVADATNVVFRTSPLTLRHEHDAATGVSRLDAAGLPSRRYTLEGGAVLGTWQALESRDADAQGRVSFEHAPGAVQAWFYRLVAPPL